MFSAFQLSNFSFYFFLPGVASPHQPPSGKVAMQDYVLNKKPEPASNETVWAFDLGNVPRPSDGRGWRAATGEGCHWPDEVNTIPQFLHKASLLIPADFAETKTAAGRRRMFRTREAHKARGIGRPLNTRLQLTVLREKAGLFQKDLARNLPC